MGKSRTSPLQKTGSSIGVGGSIGGGNSSLFHNATNVTEAKNLLKTISNNASIEITNKDIPVINEAVKQIQARMKEYGLDKFDDIQFVRNNNVLASIEDNTLKLNLNALRNPEGYWKKEQKFLEKYGVRYSAVEGKNDVLRSAIDHELGHKVYARSKYPDVNKYVNDIYSKSTIGANAPIYKISSYASTSGDSHEFFAESFAMYNHPKARNNLTSQIRDMVKNVSKKAGKK